jgi:cold shock CspA family protein
VIGTINFISRAADYAFIIESGTTTSHFVHVRDVDNRKIPAIGTEVAFVSWWEITRAS